MEFQKRSGKKHLRHAPLPTAMRVTGHWQRNQTLHLRCYEHHNVSLIVTFQVVRTAEDQYNIIDICHVPNLKSTKPDNLINITYPSNSVRPQKQAGNITPNT